jgi:hypothetical protein
MRELTPSQSGEKKDLIENLIIDTNTRDDIPNILKGLQHIYTNKKLLDKILSIMQKLFSIPQMTIGRLGMNLWSIFVLAVLRVNLNWDYDRLQNMANRHIDIRIMLGRNGSHNDGYKYPLQTIKDNVQLMASDTFDEINTILVTEGHAIIGNTDKDLNGRCDSYVMETNVHFPTDVGLLYDAIRKAINLSYRASISLGLSDWRQYKYNLSKLKTSWRKIQKIRKGNAKGKDQLLIQAHQEYIDMVNIFIQNLEDKFEMISNHSLANKIRKYLNHAYRQVDQIVRRAINGEVIPSSEKVYSIFEGHTEWVNKGKAGGKIELGVKVCIIEDQHQFILHHRVMQNESDSDIAELIVKQCQEKFPNFRSCSFDKGFDSKENQIKLSLILDTVVMPKKGKLSNLRKEIESDSNFVAQRHQHSAIESAINCLEQHGLDKCPDTGIKGFKLYVSVGIVGRNIQRIGSILRKKEQAKEQRRARKILKAA